MKQKILFILFCALCIQGFSQAVIGKNKQPFFLQELQIKIPLSDNINYEPGERSLIFINAKQMS